ncbi:hypothetical protein [Streptomyces sp. NPDC051921]|uniref:hypothetical protein n=1 Tax=Streptomyces sp. NPDC051921 TaxID=3155806 RepID=UPI00342DBABF
MGLDMTVLIADRAWLDEVPPGERLERLRDAWYDDATGLWDPDREPLDSGWERPDGPHADRFDVYEFPHGASFKAHFWAGIRWEHCREHVDPRLREPLDTLLGGLFWDGTDGEAEHVDPEVFGDGPGTYGLLLARSPDRVRELAAIWAELTKGPDGGLRAVRPAHDEHAADPHGRIGDLPAFERLLGDWGRILTEAARRGWVVVGLSE